MFFKIVILFFTQPPSALSTALMLFPGEPGFVHILRLSASLQPHWGTHHTICRHQIKPSATSNKEDRETEGEKDEEKMWFRARRGSSALHDTSHLIGYQHEPQICRRHIFRGQIGASCWDARQPGREWRGWGGECKRDKWCGYAFEGH